MILEETINKLLRDVVDLVLATPGFTIKGKQTGAPRPEGAYASVAFVTDISLGWEQHRFADEVSGTEVNETVEGMREIMMSINFYRTDAKDKGRLVRTALVKESIRALFRSAKLGLIRRSDVRDIDEPLASGWEDRSQFDVFISAVGTDSDIIANILSVDIAGEFQARGMSYNFNIEVQ